MDHYYSLAKEAEIRKYLLDGKTRKEIVELTHLQDRTIRNYIHKITDKDNKTWSEEAKESLQSRALIIKSKYERLAQVTEAIMEDEKKSPRDRIEAGKTMVACHNNIYNMIKDGPLRLNNLEIEGKELPNKNEV